MSSTQFLDSDHIMLVNAKLFCFVIVWIAFNFHWRTVYSTYVILVKIQDYLEPSFSLKDSVLYHKLSYSKKEKTKERKGNKRKEKTTTERKQKQKHCDKSSMSLKNRVFSILNSSLKKKTNTKLENFHLYWGAVYPSYWNQVTENTR